MFFSSIYTAVYYCMFELGPPTFQLFDPVHYVIVGHSFVLNCTATNDPQSPNKLTFRWFRNSRRINNNNQWNITEHVINNITVTSQLVISNLKVTQRNATFICDVHNNNKASSINQSTTVVVEGINKYVLCHTSFTCM